MIEFGIHMSKVSEMMLRREPQDEIEIGQIMQKFYNGAAGEIFRAIINATIKDQISQMHDNVTNADRRLGRAEGAQYIQDQIEIAINRMEQLQAPSKEGENE